MGVFVLVGVSLSRNYGDTSKLRKILTIVLTNHKPASKLLSIVDLWFSYQGVFALVEVGLSHRYADTSKY